MRKWGIISAAEPDGSPGVGQATSAGSRYEEAQPPTSSRKRPAAAPSKQRVSKKRPAKQSGSQASDVEELSGGGGGASAVAHADGAAPAATRSDYLCMGLLGRSYTRTGSTAVLEKIVAGARSVDAQWQAFAASGSDLRGAFSRVDEVLSSISASTDIISKGDGYTRKFVLRKILLAYTMEVGDAIDWGTFPVGFLQDCSADERQFLSAFPAAWTARDASEFVFGRGDLPLFVSMWACLWNDVPSIKAAWATAKAKGAPSASAASRGSGKSASVTEAEAEVVRFLESGEYGAKAKRLYNLSGLWLCPAMVMSENV